MEIIDLDILRPEKRVLRIATKEIDVSFIPTGLTFDIDNIVIEMSKLDQKKLPGDPEEVKKAFNLTVELCALFCSWKNPELTQEWFMENTDAKQLNILAQEIRKTLNQSYAGIEAYGKN